MHVTLSPLPPQEHRQTERELIQARIDSRRKWAKRRARLRLRRKLGRLVRKAMRRGTVPAFRKHGDQTREDAFRAGSGE